MGIILQTVDDLATSVRQLLDEANADAVDTELDILPSLNRAQDYARDVYARKYPEPFLQYTTLALDGTNQEYDIPENVFEDRIMKVEIAIPSGNGRATYTELRRISFRDISKYETASPVNVPYYYAVVGSKIRLVPPPSGTYSARLWYLENPEELVLSGGRITRINTGSNYIVVDSAGSDLTTESDQLGSYVNLIDGQSGRVKATLQIQSMTENRITFRTTPQRSTVVNRSVVGAIPATVEQDDYICSIRGTCVPYYARPTSNFLIQYAVAEITGKLDGERGTEEGVLEKFEKQIERTWVGRESQMRVQKRSSKWPGTTRRWWNQ